MALVENLAVYFADFGEPATIAGTAVTVIFDNDAVNPFDVESTNPTMDVETASVPGLAHGAPVVFRATNYTVVGIRPDASGMITTVDLTKG